MGGHALLQGISPTQGLKLHFLHLLHCRQTLLLLSQQGCPGDPRLNPGSRVSTSCPRSYSPGPPLRPLRVARDVPAALLCSLQRRCFLPNDRDGPDPGLRDSPSLMPASVSAAGDTASHAEASLSTIAEPLEQAGHRGVA